MTLEELLSENIRFEIDKEIFEKLGEVTGVDMKEQIKKLELRHESLIERQLGGLTNENIHKNG